MSETGQTFELKIRFPSQAAADDKRAVLAWLADHGVDNLVEGMIDGVEEALSEDFGEDDASPVLVFDYDATSLERLRRELEDAFRERVATSLATLSTEAWSQAWNEQADLIDTDRFRVQVNRDAPVGDDDRISLKISSDAAFGSGRHATTEVSLRMLESLPMPKARGACTFLDVGTGTAILAIAAGKLGYGPLVGTDIDEAVLAEAQANAKANDESVELLLAEGLPAGTFDVVAANILAPVLHQLMPAFARALAPGGALLLAGFIDKEAAPLLQAAANEGLVLARQLDCRGWLGLELKRQGDGR